MAVTEAPICIDLCIELLPTSPHPTTVTFEFFSPEMEAKRIPLP